MYFSELRAFLREEISAQKACNSQAVLQTDRLPFYYFVLNFSGVALQILWASLCSHQDFIHLLLCLPETVLLIFRCPVHYPDWTNTPPVSETIPDLLASMWQPDCQLSWWFICTGSQDSGRSGLVKTEQKALSLIPDFSKFNCSLKKAIKVSHQFLHQQTRNCPGIMVLNFVFFYDVLWRWEQLHLFCLAI